MQCSRFSEVYCLATLCPGRSSPQHCWLRPEIQFSSEKVKVSSREGEMSIVERGMKEEGLSVSKL